MIASNGTFHGQSMEASVFQLTPPLAKYPEGAKLLKGSDRSYIVAPFMNIVEEKYTAYFEFTQPSESVEISGDSNGRKPIISVS